ncbi:DMT family transporter [Leeia aquatica]|uniref:DMT family transporter n=1 Tax=Leeia aquatica TaxID=2725557 RepID=A0A847S921_9NEIS|nr:DMT family transporter [Leeia aquatica]NLR75467.1 DMT family transporter [Leeia aquatica]
MRDMNHYRNLLALHGAVLLFGLAAVAGKYLNLPAVLLVAGRSGFAALALWGWLRMTRAGPGSGWHRDVLGCGLLLAIHWWTFFQSILLGSVATGLLGWASYPLFVAVLEPWCFGEPRRTGDLWRAALVGAGIAVVATERTTQVSLMGLAWGVASGLSFAGLTLANRRLSTRLQPAQLAFWQNAGAAIWMLPWLHIPADMGRGQWLGLVALGVGCTALAHSLFMFCLRQLPARLVSVTAALEVVYGVLLAAWLLHEWPSLQVLAGMALILVATVWATRRR